MSRATLLADATREDAAPLRRVSRGPGGTVDPHLTSLIAPGSFEAAQYRRLRIALEQLHESRGIRVVAFSSAAPGEGKTLTTINTAGALAQTRALKVLLIDADLRRPSVGRYLGVTPSKESGLSDYVHDARLTLSDIVRREAALDFDVILGGSRAASTPYETLHSPRLRQMLTEARGRYDHVLIDTPPLLAVPDCQLLAGQVDGLVLIVRAHKTSKQQLSDVLRDRDALKIVGLVFNSDDECGRGYDNSYYR